MAAVTALAAQASLASRGSAEAAVVAAAVLVAVAARRSCSPLVCSWPGGSAPQQAPIRQRGRICLGEAPDTY